MVVNIRFPFLLLLATLLFAGCSSTDIEDEISVFEEPKPGRSVGVVKEWKRSVSSEPDEFLNHPRHIAVTDDAVYTGTIDGLVVRVDKADWCSYLAGKVGSCRGWWRRCGWRADFCRYWWWLYGGSLPAKW